MISFFLKYANRDSSKNAICLVRWALLAIGLFFTLVCTPLAFYYGVPLLQRTLPSPSDVIVLLSSGCISGRWVTPDGMQRTAGALLLYRQRYAPIIVSSGSQRNCDQAGIQSEWLKLAGVPEEAIIVERQSTRTYESGQQVSKIMRQRGLRSAVVVASELDVPRVRLVFEKMGMPVSFLAVPEFKPPEKLLSVSGFSFFCHATYEYAALTFYKLKGWI
jgi:uncharacterized SAM-binding protein YcdF (DUF218 family)